MKIKIIFTSILAILYFSACNNTTQSPVMEIKIPSIPQMVGGDSDVHGCKASAGYQWSVLKNECIRAFELKIKFQNLKVASQGGWLLLSDDDQKAEFFGIEGTTSVVFNKGTGNNINYGSVDGKYILNEPNPDHWQVLDVKHNDEKIFETIIK